MSKIKRKKMFVAITLSAVLLLSAGLVAATRDGGFHKGFHKDPERMRAMVEWKVNDMLDEIDADDTQRESILGSVNTLFDEGMALRGDKDDHKELIHQELAKDNPDREKLQAMIDGKLDKARTFSEKVLDTVLDIHSELTPEQREKLMELVDEHHREHRHHH